jgi:hypothetical protein
LTRRIHAAALPPPAEKTTRETPGRFLVQVRLDANIRRDFGVLRAGMLIAA